MRHNKPWRDRLLANIAIALAPQIVYVVGLALGASTKGANPIAIWMPLVVVLLVNAGRIALTRHQRLITAVTTMLVFGEMTVVDNFFHGNLSFTTMIATLHCCIVFTFLVWWEIKDMKNARTSSITGSGKVA